MTAEILSPEVSVRSAAVDASVDTWTFHDGGWHAGNHPIMGSRTHAAWLGSSVFDGGRVFDGCAPDLRAHMERVNASASALLLEPQVAIDEWMALAKAGISLFAAGETLYVRPMYWAEQAAPGGGVRFEPSSTRWCLCVYKAPLPTPTGLSITLSRFRRPTCESAPTGSKAGCLYPNASRAMIEARCAGYDNCAMLDALGNVAELANSNIFLAKDGAVHTPVPNGTFLNGITRQRTIALLEADGVAVHQRAMRWEDFLTADEIFATGNYSKVVPVTRVEGRVLAIGPVSRLARALYWRFASAHPVKSL